MMDGMGMMVWGVFGVLLALLLIFLFIVTVVAVVKWIWGRDNALDVLQRRYA